VIIITVQCFDLLTELREIGAYLHAGQKLCMVVLERLDVEKTEAVTAAAHIPAPVASTCRSIGISRKLTVRCETGPSRSAPCILHRAPWSG